ncbi:MAG: signal peptidase II [Peptoniphilaceae bacterium]|uniref:signal peptidase II n=1 Tax=Parvimonas sp. TaxID=1944660 RepID=UPI0025E05DE1|nr:signal peptidase II [Parvimonas sp.]MCI5996710.1 signal peptidase II [Parvimonas sp.]MDD7764311.1 signal peptidase II [Peptoniphilaceae bacterium]MDY3050010.1 signal peptidase II [Parvimonas sp.]
MIYIILFVGLVLDQFTKYIALTQLKGANSIVIIKDWLEFTYVENTGVAFGSFSGYKYFFIVVAIIAFIFINFYIYKNKDKIPKIEQILFILIACGALGNAIDRILYSYVIDFIHTKIGGLYDFPVFNFADIYISVSCILMIIISFFKKEK